MANHKSALKAIRQTIRRTEENHSRLSRIKTFTRRVERAVQAKDKTLAQSEFRLAEAEIMRGAQHNLYHKNNAARKVSRLFRLVKQVA